MNDPEFEKLERNGKIAVLYSPSYGAGWSTWNSGREGLLFDKEIVEAVLAGDLEKAVQIAEQKYPEVYVGGGDSLEVSWVPKGSRFMVDEYDGSETVIVLSLNFGHLA